MLLDGGLGLAGGRVAAAGGGAAAAAITAGCSHFGRDPVRPHPPNFKVPPARDEETAKIRPKEEGRKREQETEFVVVL